jgi:aldose 1-epimerase
MKRIPSIVYLLGLATALSLPLFAKSDAGVTKADFGSVDGQANTLYTLTNAHGMSISVMNYGAILVKLMAPDKSGKLEDVVLGYDDVSGYESKGDPHFGSTVGRYGNRIAKGKFSLDGKEYSLALNDPPNTLHGGVKGFDKQMWKGEIASQNPPAVVFSRVSPDGEEGYPGNLTTSVKYTLTDKNEIKVYFTATTDKPTVVNLTHHSYFNLSGAGSGPVLDDLVTINADAYTPVDATLIPTGEIKKVAGTPMDFRKPHTIGERINEVPGKPVGYDHNFVLNGYGSGVEKNATVVDPKSGRRLTVSSDQPGLQFYTGNFLDGTVTGKGGKVYDQHTAFCFEPQHFPDSPNEPKFPSVVLRPGKTYHSTIIYGFDVVK